jgi:glucosylceramidase
VTTRFLSAITVAFVAMTGACSSGTATNSGLLGGSQGVSGPIGGSLASGGAASTHENAGSGGHTDAVGSLGSGGIGAGGDPASGGAANATTATGGKMGSGGTTGTSGVASGGKTGSGGISTSGGTRTSSGTTGTGGTAASSGGSGSATGGRSSAGGGSIATGGAGGAGTAGASVGGAGGSTAAIVTWISSTGQQPWKSMPAPVIGTANPNTSADVQVELATTYQTIDGFGGCFNELGWSALSKASATDRQAVLSALFGDNGCAFNLARVPIGASDFALSGYSLDDTAGDLELKSFSTARDEKNLIPYIKAAMEVSPTLQVWGSPWSPPVWMKTNNSIGGGSLKWDPAILRSYATYLARWVESYRGAGINVYGLIPQNEPNITNVYPTCLWTAAQLREFIADYLGPILSDRKTQVELWLGLNGDPINGGENPDDRLGTVLKDSKAKALLTGIEFQYDSKQQMCTARTLYPDKKLMQGETECKGGANSWGDAQSLFGLMKRYLECGANAYFLWNLVLDDTGLSSWNWKQNASITVNRSTGAVTYNGEYYVMRHFSQFVKRGAKRVLTSGALGDKIAFVNTDGSTVVVVGNATAQSRDVNLTVHGRTNGDTIKATLPAQSINTFIVGP